MAVVLEVQTLTKHFRFSSQILQPTIFEIGNYLIRLFIILGTIDSFTSRNRLAECLTFTFKVMP